MKNMALTRTICLRSLSQGGVALAVASILAACSSTPMEPVENRSTFASGAQRVDPKTLPGYEYMGKPGYYTVQPGDTMRAVARMMGQDWRALAAWNSHWVPNPDQLEVGQVLRIVAPAGAAVSAYTARSDAGSARAAVQAAKPVSSAQSGDTAPPPRQTAAGSAGTSATTSARRPSAHTPRAVQAIAGRIAIAWPTQSRRVIAKFNADLRGIDIGGNLGDPVVAAADGMVVNSVNLRGYGRMVLLLHDGGYSTSYSFLDEIKVAVKQRVKAGQVVGTMGKNATGQPAMHFELRGAGHVFNPLEYLPSK